MSQSKFPPQAPTLSLAADALLPVKGRITRVLGTILRATVSEARIGEECVLRDPFTGSESRAVIIGLDGDEAILTPLGSMHGISSRSEVIATGALPRIRVGDALLGRVIDAYGEPLDGEPLDISTERPLRCNPPTPMSRPPIDTVLPTSLRAIDGCLTCGLGQRLGIFGPAGTGKSTLLSALLRDASADVVVLGLIGERGREVREFVEGILDENSMKRAVIIVATSDRPALERVRAADAATAVAETFRDQGKSVLLVIDSITRIARAHREVGLAAGEPPTRRGFPPSVFSELPKLVERAGPAARGIITAFYTVLLDGDDDSQDPVADEVRGLLDGHIILSRDLAARGHFPAIDVLASVSRLMGKVADQEHIDHANALRSMMAKLNDVELLVQVGEYEKGLDKEADRALERRDAIDAFLRQSSSDPTNFAAMRAMLAEIVA